MGPASLTSSFGSMTHSLFMSDVVSMIGPWTVLTAVAALAGWALSSTSLGKRVLCHETPQSTVTQALSSIMVLLALFLVLILLPASQAFSGSPERAVKRDFHQLDVRLAGSTALVFGIAFTIDRVRDQFLRRQAWTWALVLLNGLMIAVIVGMSH